MTATRTVVLLAALLACATAGCACALDGVRSLQGNALYGLHAALRSEFRIDSCALEPTDNIIEVSTPRHVRPQQQIHVQGCWAAALAMAADYYDMSTTQERLADQATSAPECGSRVGIELQRMRRVTLVDDGSRAARVVWLSRGDLPSSLWRHLATGPAIWLRRTTSARDGHAYVITGGRFRVVGDRTQLVSLTAIDPEDGASVSVSCPRFVRETHEVAVFDVSSQGAR